jgi:hypothetical protein
MCMKKTLTIGTIVLGCCLLALAQTSSYPNQGPPASFPGNSIDQSGSAVSTNQSSSQKTTVQGCLTQSADGFFLLSDASAKSYQLNDGSSRLAQFVGKEIRVDGFGFNRNSEPTPGSMSASPSELNGPVQQIDVTKVRKVSDRCQTRPGAR